LDVFEYSVSDGVSQSQSTHVYISISDTAPIARFDSYSVLHDSTLTVAPPGLLANDSDSGSGGFGVYDFSMPKHGVLDLSSYDGAFIYRPVPGFVGVDSFTYVIVNNTGLYDSASVRI